MKIYSIETNNISYKSIRDDYVTKKFLETKNSRKKFTKIEENIINAASLVITGGLGINEILKNKGISYCEVKDNTVNAFYGYNGGYYSFKINSTNLDPELLKAYFAESLLREKPGQFGGLENYREMVNDLKRQDIIQKGLKLHTYELNTSISKEQREILAKNLSHLTKKSIKPEYLFFIDTDAYYYDKLEKTAYSINVFQQKYAKFEPTFRVCKFSTDRKGNATGFSVTADDIYQQRRVTKTYTEQNTISESLPEIADSTNNKLFAEAFRFGNNKIVNHRIEAAIPLVLEHLRNRVGIKNISKDDLQFVKLYDDNKNIINRICYYDPTTGRSLVYNENSKYLCQIEYNKDDFGNIIACTKY